MQELFQAIRAVCSPATWSKGIELVRSGAVSAGRRAPEEMVLRVKSPGRAAAPTVTLYPLEREWDCDCGSPAAACEHVAAAAIPLRRAGAPDAGAARPLETSDRLGYRLVREGGRLRLERSLVLGDGTERPLAGTLASLVASDQERAARVAPTEVDLTIDRLVGPKRVRTLEPETLPALLPLLAQVEDVLLDGSPIRVGTEPVLPHAVVEERGDGFELVIERAASLAQIVVPGVVLCLEQDGAALRPLGEAALTGPSLERLPLRRFFGPTAVAELVAEVLPELQGRIEVEIRTARLPAPSKAASARILLEVEQQEAMLCVLPLLVYGNPPCARLDGERLVHLGGPPPARDERAERLLTRELGEALGLVPGRRVRLVAGEAVAMAAKLRRWPGEIRGRAHEELYPEGDLEPRFEPQAEGFSLGFEAAPARAPAADAPALRADPARVLEAWREGLGVVALQGGGWASIPWQWLERHGQRLCWLLEARRQDGSVPACARPGLMRLCDELALRRPPALARLAPLLDGGDRIPPAVLPDDLTATLRGYQRQGIDWLCLLREAGLGALLADDMGLGKTLQALCAVGGRTLVVCPTSLIFNWVAEILRFRPGLRHAVFHGPGRELEAQADVTVTSYAVLRLDAERLGRERWDCVVLDEAQAIKNPDSQVAQAAYGLDASFRLSLSGTPVENRLDELWSQMHFTNRGLLGSRAEFERTHGRPIAAGLPGAADGLRERIRPFVLRRLKREVAPELPPRIETVLLCELSEPERELYDVVRLATRKDVVARLATGASVLDALEALLRLRQAACHPGLVPGERAEGSAKTARLMLALEQAVPSGHKALVFSQWTSLLDLIEPHLHAAAISFVRLDGATRDRAGVVARFQDAAGPPVMLLSLKAGGAGLNLTAADHVFLLDPWWNPAAEDQAADRAHRIGQDRPVMIHRLVARTTVEERILELQERKRALGEAALGEAGRAASLTRADLLALLGD
ncbi:MAG: DEAD/DEAH box helicase [Deltaproteobacteria bacterium]|nr:DEAD/DEAH box helicase [Deltaproteobacteria bacterium]